MIDRPTKEQTLIKSGHDALGKLDMPPIPFAWSKILIFVIFHDSVTDGPTDPRRNVTRPIRPTMRPHDDEMIIG